MPSIYCVYFRSNFNVDFKLLVLVIRLLRKLPAKINCYCLFVCSIYRILQVLLCVWMFPCISILSSHRRNHTESGSVCHTRGRSMFPPNSASSTCCHRALQRFRLVHRGSSESTVEGSRLTSGTSYQQPSRGVQPHLSSSWSKLV